MRTFTLAPFAIVVIRVFDVEGPSRMLTAEVARRTVPTGTDSLTASPVSSTGVSSAASSALEQATSAAAEKARMASRARESFMTVLAGKGEM